jgi:hypothetical protein
LGYLSAVCTFLNASVGASTISAFTTSGSIRRAPSRFRSRHVG